MAKGSISFCHQSPLGFGEQTELLAQNHKLSADATDGFAIVFVSIISCAGLIEADFRGI